MNLVVRSTNVPIAERSNPMMRSPSQCPGTARSSASAGRSLIITSGVTWPQAFCCDLERGTRKARPVRKQATSSRFERPSALDVERLVDRLVADPHGLIIGEIDPQPLGDLFGTPGLHPAAIRSMGLALSVPLRTWWAHQSTIKRPLDGGQSFLDVVPQRFIRGQLGCLRPSSPPFGMPLRGRCLVLETKGSGRRVATKLSRDRRRIPVQSTGNLARTPSFSARVEGRCPRAPRKTSSGHSQLGKGKDSPRQRGGTIGYATGDDTPASRPASSLFRPRAIAAQNLTRSSRQAIEGRPGDGMWPR